MAGILTVDTVDMSTLGLTVSSVRGHRAAPVKKWPRKTVPGRVDSVVLSSEPNWEPRKVEVYGTITAATHALAMTARNSLETAIHTPDTVDVTFIDNPTQKLVCRCEGFDVWDFKAGFAQPGFPIKITLIADDPRYVAV